MVTAREQNALKKCKAQLQDAGNTFIDFFFLYVVAEKA